MSNVTCPWGISAKHAMLDRGLSVSALAKEVGASRVYVSGILSGRVYSDKMVDRISAFLNISNDYSVIFMKQDDPLAGRISLYENTESRFPSVSSQPGFCPDDELPVADEPKQITRNDFIFAEDPSLFETMPIEE